MSMIGRIIVALFLVALLIFGVIWTMSGGLSRALAYAQTISNPIDLFAGDASGEPFSLPGEPDYMGGPELDFGYGYDTAIADPSYGGLEQIPGFADDPQTYGNPSPESMRAHLSFGSAGISRADQEYLRIEADPQNTAPLSISGWSLQSVYSGARYKLPPATPLFTQGTVNTVRNVSLAPGETAIVSSGISPVGVSFRENECSGYLDQFQTFTPELYTQCPDPALEVVYDPTDVSCAWFLQSIPPCTFPAQISADISPQCRTTVAAALSYNSCVNRHQLESGFSLSTWRLYLGSTRPLWGAHDVVRLLDESGRVVDVLTY